MVAVRFVRQTSNERSPVCVLVSFEGLDPALDASASLSPPWRSR